jgi:butyrate kinase
MVRAAFDNKNASVRQGKLKIMTNHENNKQDTHEINELNELNEFQQMVENSKLRRDFIRTRFEREFEQMQLKADESELTEKEQK